MNQVPFERLFAMSAMDGLYALRLKSLDLGDRELGEIAELLARLDGDAAGLDFEAALALHDIVRADAPVLTPGDFFRVCICEIILSQHASWARAVVLGRQMLLKQLTRDEQQCFRSAGLLDAPPSLDVVEWWDKLANEIRDRGNQEKLARGRLAERLSLEHEAKRLAALGISEVPRWIAIEDNTAGYDVLSYEPGPYGVVNRMIEVKSTIASPLRFYLSRNEWEKAIGYGKAYRFHLWHLVDPNPRLYERTLEQVRAHIPADQSNGKWESATIPVGPN